MHSFFTFLSSLSFFTSLSISKKRCFHELLNDLLFLEFSLKHELLPFFIKFNFSDFTCFLLHSFLFSGTLFSKVHFFKLLIFLFHKFSFFPLLESLSIIESFVSLEVLLNQTRVINVEIVHTKVKINQSIVMFQFFSKLSTTVFIKHVIGQVQRKKGCVGIQKVKHL